MQLEKSTAEFSGCSHLPPTHPGVAEGEVAIWDSSLTNCGPGAGMGPLQASVSLLHNRSSHPTFNKCPQTPGRLGSMLGPGTGHLISLGEDPALLAPSRNSGEGDQSQTQLPCPRQDGTIRDFPGSLQMVERRQGEAAELATPWAGSKGPRICTHLS